MAESQMNPEIKAGWLEDLRSGNFQQGEGKLHTATRNADGTERHEFCCLGVLCERAVAAGVVERVDLSETFSQEAEQGVTVYGYVPARADGSLAPVQDGYSAYPPVEVAVWADMPLDDANPYVTREISEGLQPIANVNDGGASFTEIADIIAEQL